MSRKIVLYIATSLDGFIAKDDGSVDWLVGESRDPHVETGYGTFINTIDTILMGWTTYHQLVTELSPDEWPYPGKKCYVASSKPREKQEHVEIITGDIVKFIREQQNLPGEDIWLVGGGKLIAPFVEQNLIDEYILTIIPTLLGSGIPLFRGAPQTIDLHLKKTLTFDGMVQLIYTRRAE